ncbi:BamA/OMP85 family outer membrane protein [Lacibacter sediminis]|uniref:BamA/TamA family outer membrane protein n=1 Tax=Lacibacter sediminis TaxID=2760713 RepID=A0A7G5XHE0_9BACT|nr:POTRA domain-containing protein [Lacibacter sediminis]QNA44893.1 BamA/TamA family outer membrane protein [Lacibacter sediminis]
MRLNRKLLLLILICSSVYLPAMAQQTDTTKPVSVDPELEAIMNSKVPREYIIAGITVSGSKTFDSALLVSVSGISVGDKVYLPGGDLFSKAIAAIWRQQYFDDATIYITKVDGKDIYIEINVTERARLGNFFFRGIKKGEEDELKEKVGLTPNKVITENLRRTSIEKIEKFYSDKGFRQIDVKISETKNAVNPNFIDLTFNVNKGKKVKIDEIFISGNEVVSDLKIKKQLKGTKERMRFTLYPEKNASAYGGKDSVTFKEFMKDRGFLSLSKVRDFLDPWFRIKFSAAKFNQNKYIEDKEKILTYYNSLGYRDAVIEKDTNYYNSKGNLVIDVKVDEGRQYYFGNITWRGNTKYSDSVLNNILGIQRGDIYNLETLNSKLGKQLSAEGGDISGLYMDDGYLFFRVEPIETKVYNDTIDYEIRLSEGPQATIRSINIYGNDKTKEYVIRRELRTIPGEKFSRSDMIRSIRELSALNYFNPEKINPNPVPNPDDGTVDINYTLEEKSSDQLELSAGWGGLIGLTGTLGVTFNNFSTKNIFKKSAWQPLPSGDGQRLSIRVQSNGPSFSSQNFSFTEPWLGGKKRNNLTLSLFRTKLANAFDPLTGLPLRKKSEDAQYLRTFGASVSLGKQLKWPDDFFNLITSVNYTQYKLKDYPIFPELDSGVSNNINLRFQIIRSSVDQPTFPRSGSTFSLTATFTPPWSLFRDASKYSDPAEKYRLVEYHKWRLNYEWFIPIGKPAGAEKNRQFVLKAAAKFGFLGRYNKDLPISPFERFQVGDAGLQNNFGIIGFDIIAHRGYPVYDNSNPRINNANQTSATQFFTIFNKYSMELRYPLSTNPSSTIFGLAFFEAANGWYDVKDYNPFKLRRSAGLGMRFFLPMFGLLGFDYGVGLDRTYPGARFRDISKFTFMLGFEPE